MKKILLFLGAALHLSFASSSELQNSNPIPFAVVELFTSEGCSSCPPADNLLMEIAKEAKAKNRNILTLSFHVDYWNYLGWSDPFSQEKFTDRQKLYAEILNSRVYTPQMIINGRYEFVGSNKTTAKNHIENIFAKQSNDATEADLKISLESKWSENKENLEIRYSVPDAQKNRFIHFAIVGKNLSSNVSKGENRGKNLIHHNVVLRFSTQNIKDTTKGMTRISMKNLSGFSEKTLIAYIQEPESMQIFIGVETAIPNL